MKKFQKTVSLALSATMLLGSTTVFAMPNDTVILNGEAFTIDALFDADLLDEIKSAVSTGDDLYYNLESTTGDDFNSIFGNEKMLQETKDKLVDFTLTNEDGLKVVYEKFSDDKGVATVATKEELLAQVNNGYAGVVKLAGDIELEAEKVAVKRLVNIDLDGHTLKGNVDVVTAEGGEMEILGLKDSKLDGALTIDTGKADFKVAANVTIEGKTTIKDVKSSTFINKGTLKEVVIEDPNGSGFQNDGAVETIAIHTAAKVTLKGEKEIPKVIVDVEDAEVTLEVNVATVEADKPFKIVKESNIKVHKLEGEGVAKIHIEDAAGHELDPASVIDIVKPGPVTPDKPVVPPVVNPGGGGTVTPPTPSIPWTGLKPSTSITSESFDMTNTITATTDDFVITFNGDLPSGLEYQYSNDGTDFSDAKAVTSAVYLPKTVTSNVYKINVTDDVYVKYGVTSVTDKVYAPTITVVGSNLKISEDNSSWNTATVTSSVYSNSATSVTDTVYIKYTK